MSQGLDCLDIDGFPDSDSGSERGIGGGSNSWMPQRRKSGDRTGPGNLLTVAFSAARAAISRP
jgi:hypothetical protein